MLVAFSACTHMHRRAATSRMVHSYPPVRDSEAAARAAAMADAGIARHLDGHEIRKVIWVPGRMMSFVVS